MNTEIDEIEQEEAIELEAPAAPRRRLDWRILLILGLAASSIPIARALRPKATASIPVEAQAVAVSRAARTTLTRELTVQAELKPFQEVDLHAKVAGYLQEISVDVGDQVQAGQVLARLEIPELQDDFRRAKAVEQRSLEEARRAEAAFKEAHSAFERLEAVDKAQPKLIAPQDLDVARARDEQASSALAAARQQVEIAKAESSKLKTMSEYSSIRAPFSGVITRRYADPGALIQAGISSSTQAMPLVHLAQIDKLRVVFPVSMSYVDQVRVGTRLKITIQNSSRVLEGAVSRITKKIETSTRTMDCEMDVPNKDLIPGMYAQASIVLDRHTNAVAVPVQAIEKSKTPSVLVVNAKGEIEKRPVQLGIETANRIEIVSGISDGDLVLVGSRAQVRPGLKVKPRMQEND